MTVLLLAVGVPTPAVAATFRRLHDDEAGEHRLSSGRPAALTLARFWDHAAARAFEDAISHAMAEQHGDALQVADPAVLDKALNYPNRLQKILFGLQGDERTLRQAVRDVASLSQAGFNVFMLAS